MGDTRREADKDGKMIGKFMIATASWVNVLFALCKVKLFGL